jgi:multimeric flavodoxin WrbA
MGDKILVVNGSPRADKGITNLVINKFLEGCHEKGATSEVIHVSKAKLRHCAGELACFFRPNVSSCQIHKSDQGKEFLEKWVAADRIVLASPLHFNIMSSYLMRFLERLICLSDPVIANNDGFPTHRGPYESKPGAVIGVGAYPGVANFDLFREVMLNLLKVFWLDPGGYVLVPMSRDLTVVNETNPRHEALTKILEAISQAGREWMEFGEISPETEEAVSADSDDINNLHNELDSYFIKLNM